MMTVGSQLCGGNTRRGPKQLSKKKLYTSVQPSKENNVHHILIVLYLFTLS